MIPEARALWKREREKSAREGREKEWRIRIAREEVNARERIKANKSNKWEKKRVRERRGRRSAHARACCLRRTVL